jgi:hypothetical protein
MIRLTAVFVVTALLAATLFLVATIEAAPQHGFSLPEYNQFHDVLHPLEHEALPKNDYGTIRAKAGQLVFRGRSIVKLGVPAGMKDEQKEEFAKELKKFDHSLNKFRVDARRSSNTKLRRSYSAVHDSFEILVAMVERR